jgi:hypothetical protein
MDELNETLNQAWLASVSWIHTHFGLFLVLSALILLILEVVKLAALKNKKDQLAVNATIKIEVDLRDIRNAIKGDHAEDMQQTLPSFVDAKPQKGIFYTDSELEAMRSAGGRGH